MTTLEEPQAAESPRGLRPRELMIVALVVVVLLVVGVGVGLLERQRRAEPLSPQAQAEQIARATCDEIWSVPLVTEGLSPQQITDRLANARTLYAEAAARAEGAAALDPRWEELAAAMSGLSEVVADYAALVADGSEAGDAAAIAALRARGGQPYDVLVAQCRALRVNPAPTTG